MPLFGVDQKSQTPSQSFKLVSRSAFPKMNPQHHPAILIPEKQNSERLQCFEVSFGDKMGQEV